MTSLIRKMTLVFASLALVVSFQNCSKVQPSILTQDVSGKSVGSDDTVADEADDVDSAIVDEEYEHDDGEACDHDHEADYSKEKLIADCGAAKKAAVSAAGDISDVRGSMILKANALGKVSDIRGNLIIVADTAASVTIESVINIRGKVVLCDAIIGKIDDTRGSLILVNTIAGSVSNHRGNIYSYKSKIQSLSNNRGVIKEIAP